MFTYPYLFIYLLTASRHQKTDGSPRVNRVQNIALTEADPDPSTIDEQLTSNAISGDPIAHSTSTTHMHPVSIETPVIDIVSPNNSADEEAILTE